MTHYTQYIQYHVGLLQGFKESAQSQFPFNSDTDPTEDDKEFIRIFEELCQSTHYTDTLNAQGQWALTRIISTYSHLTPLLARDLFWFFGGDCLHYMPDEEISFFQQLDELRYSAEENNLDFDYAAAKSSLSKSH